MERLSNTQVLSQFGLSEQESLAYLALLRLGGAPATALAEEIGIKRTTIYPILDKLIAEGLVSKYDQGKKHHYLPLKPISLPVLFEKKLQMLNDILPALEKLGDARREEFGVKLIQTKQELRNFYHDILDSYRDRNYRVIGSSVVWQGIDDDFFINYRLERARRNIRTELLLSADSREHQPNEQLLLRTYKFLPNKYKFRSTIDIFDDKILIIGPDVKALAVVIAIPPMVDVFKIVFEALWEVIS